MQEVGAGSAEVQGHAVAPRRSAPVLSIEAAALLETVEIGTGSEPGALARLSVKACGTAGRYSADCRSIPSPRPGR